MSAISPRARWCLVVGALLLGLGIAMLATGRTGEACGAARGYLGFLSVRTGEG